MKTYKNTDSAILAIVKTISNLEDRLNKARGTGANPKFIALLEQDIASQKARMGVWGW
jgi:hypothetical protein